MIDAKELRIGNIVYVNWNEGRKIETCFCVYKVPFGMNDKFQGQWMMNTCEKGYPVKLEIVAPIPLTPEILKQCGFKEKKEKFAESEYLYYERDVLQIKQVNDGFIRIDFTQLGIVEYIVIYQHLHQMQNLFFALIGEELTVNL